MLILEISLARTTLQVFLERVATFSRRRRERGFVDHVGAIELSAVQYDARDEEMLFRETL